jgi:DNA primase
MAKIAPSSIKYIIYAKFNAEGAIEKPDVIGAIFGQTEGLLGEDMEMRELQKQGKIGRIDVNLTLEDGMSKGEIEIPSAMDKSETSLIAAAIETIEKVGPSETKVIVERIEDVRGNKRDYILERAKQLMSGMSGTEEFKDMGRELGAASRTLAIKTYGTENLPCGDLSGEEVIVVEGRADVVNMLKQGVKNVICMNGVKLPETVKELSQEKEITLFVDGDRGGKLIAKNVNDNARIAFIAVAPEGKEVEELTSKEILQALRRRMTIKEYFEQEEKNKRFGRYERNDRYSRNETKERDSEEESEAPVKTSRVIQKMTAEEKETVKQHLDELIGTKAAVIFNKNMEVIKKMPISRLGYIRVEEQPYILAINDTAIPPIIRAAESMGVSNLVAKNFTTTDTSINLVSI